jgi:hypothetical protein
MKRGLAVAAVLALSGVRCDWVQDRFQSCSLLPIDLIDSEQGVQSITLIADGEPLDPAYLLAPGASRRISRCVERGDAKRFHAFNGSTEVDVANCVVSRSREEFASTVVRVVWYPQGLACENW